MRSRDGRTNFSSHVDTTIFNRIHEISKETGIPKKHMIDVAFTLLIKAYKEQGLNVFLLEKQKKE